MSCGSSAPVSLRMVPEILMTSAWPLAHSGVMADTVRVRPWRALTVEFTVVLTAVLVRVVAAAVPGVVATMGASDAVDRTASSVAFRITRPPGQEYGARPQWYGLSAATRPPRGVLWGGGSSGPRSCRAAW